MLGIGSLMPLAIVWTNGSLENTPHPHTKDLTPELDCSLSEDEDHAPSFFVSYTAGVYSWKDGACPLGDSIPKTQQAGPGTELVPVMCSLHVAPRKE